MVGDAMRTAPGCAPEPGSCRACGGPLGAQWLVSALGEEFCAAHEGDPACALCAAPASRSGYCRGCAATAVNTRDQLRAGLPGILAVLHDRALRTDPPVRVRLGDQTDLGDPELPSAGRL